MIDAVSKGRGRWWATQRKVPFEEIGFLWFGVVVWRRGGGEFGGLAQDAPYGWGFGVECLRGHLLWWKGYVGLRGDKSSGCLVVMGLALRRSFV